jgi:hypothetical protein
MSTREERHGWACGVVADEYREKITNQRDTAMRALLKGGEKHHAENAESYKAYDRVLKILSDFKDSK